MFAFTFLPPNIIYTEKLALGKNEKAEGKMKLPWEGKVDKHTSVRKMTKE